MMLYIYIYIHTHYVSVNVYVYTYHITDVVLCTFTVHTFRDAIFFFFGGGAGVKWREGRSIKPNFQLDNLDIFFGSKTS